MMAMNFYLTQRLIEERIKDALCEAEQARLARMTKNYQGTQRSYLQQCNTSASNRVVETDFQKKENKHIVLGTGAELVVGLVLLRREGYDLTLYSLQDRIHWRWPKGWKAQALAGVVFILGMSLSMMMGTVNRSLAAVPGFVPPVWWPAASNPTIKVASAVDVFPDITLEGNYLFVLLDFIIGLVFNIFGEEIYYRGFLLPQMRWVFGRWDWVANGLLFTLKHVYQRWLFPGILVGGLAFAFAAGPVGSSPLAMVYHWVGNFLFNMIFLIMAALGVGQQLLTG